MVLEKLGEASGWQGMLGRDIEGLAGETIGWGKLRGKKKGEEELGFAGPAIEAQPLLWSEIEVHWSYLSPVISVI